MKTVIVTSFDANYMPYAKVMVQSFINNYNQDTIIDLYCLVSKDILDQESLFVNSLNSINKVNVKFMFSDKFDLLNVSDGGWITKNAWHRIYIPSICVGFDKAIYIDPDTMIMRDVAPLLNYKMQSPFMAYVQDEFSDYSKDIYGSPDLVYINDGVFITDLNFWREQNMESRMTDYINKNKQTAYADQDVINLFFREYIYPLPVTFNLFVDKLELYTATPDPLIVHFNGKNKPWSCDIDNIYHRQWKKLFESLTLI